MAMEAIVLPKPKSRNPRLKTCGTGPIKSMSLNCTYARAENKHKRDDRGRDQDGTADVSRGRPGLARQEMHSPSKKYDLSSGPRGNSIPMTP
jgi:hypothetical protein